MSNVNPGPAVNGIANTMGTLMPQNTGTFPVTPDLNGYRCLGTARAVPLGVAGDPSVIPIINSSVYVPAIIVTTNGLISGATGNVASATLGVYTAVGGAGTAVLTTAALTGQTVNTFAYVRATTDTSTTLTAQNLFVHIVTTVTNGTTDVFLYGYDLS
jgi:hypothetical protein